MVYLRMVIVTLVTGVCVCVCAQGWEVYWGQFVALQQCRGRGFMGFDLLQSESERESPWERENMAHQDSLATVSK